MIKTLHLPVNKQWYDMIASGEKKEEYRIIKSHWISHMISKDFAFDCDTIEKIHCHLLACPNGFFKHFDVVCFKNGYGKNAPTLYVECKGIKIGTANLIWSDGFERDVFVISLGEIIEKP